MRITHSTFPQPPFSSKLERGAYQNSLPRAGSLPGRIRLHNSYCEIILRAGTSTANPVSLAQPRIVGRRWRHAFLATREASFSPSPPPCDLIRCIESVSYVYVHEYACVHVCTERLYEPFPGRKDFSLLLLSTPFPFQRP